MSTIHVDETTGSDDTGKGMPELPYQSLAFALYTHPDAKLLVRKDAAGTYEEPTQSALKKAKKGADGLEKKRKKAEELAEREAKEKKEERERREKLIEESKKIVLVEDESLPKAKKVRRSHPTRPPSRTHSFLRFRQKSATSSPFAVSVSQSQDGCIVCGARRTSYSSSSVTEQATSSACFPAKW